MSVVIEKQEGLSIQYLIAINHGRNRIILSLSTFFFFLGYSNINNFYNIVFILFKKTMTKLATKLVVI